MASTCVLLCPEQGTRLQDAVVQPPPGAAGTYPGAPPDWWSCRVLAVDIDEAAVEGADGVQEPRATSLDCSDPQQVPSQLAPLALPRGLGGHLFLPPGPAEGMVAPVPHHTPLQDPGQRLGYSPGPWDWPRGPEGWTVTFSPLLTPSPLGKTRDLT